LYVPNYAMEYYIYIYTGYPPLTLSQEISVTNSVSLDDSIYAADVEVTLVNTVKLLIEGMIFFA
jgi:hypothetical protein